MLDLFLIPTAYAGVDELIRKVNKVIINPLITLIFVVAVVIFIYGVVEFLRDSENEEGRATGKQHMLWGIVGIFIMVAVFAIMQIIINTLGVKGIDPRQGTVELR